MLPLYTRDILLAADSVAQHDNITNVYRTLQQLPFADFCTLNMGVPDEYPNLKSIMPVMPTDKVQKQWTGDFGISLMNRTCNTARLIQILSYKHTGSGLSGKKILDYGCGWGRVLRIMNYFTNMTDIYGLDVMQTSFAALKKCRICNPVAKCDKRPLELPFDDTKFDLIFSFSVFTHIPDSVAITVLKAVRKRVTDNGVFILTIRSYEFWDLREDVWPPEMVEKMRIGHNTKGYAFQTFDNGADINADYGDTTMSFDYLAGLAGETGWRLADIERDLLEPYQIAMVLKPV